MYGAANFEARRLGHIRLEPWLVPLVSMDTTEDVPDAFVRQSKNLDRDLIVLRPGESYQGYVRVPDDSIIRLLDMTVEVRERVTVGGRSTYLAFPERSDAATEDQAAARLVYGATASEGYSSEISMTLVNAGRGLILAEEGTPLDQYLTLGPRPTGLESPLSHLLPNRGILEFRFTHNGWTPELCISGVFRGMRVRL